MVAHDLQMAIGLNGDLLKRYKPDMQWFQRMTANRVCIVGRKTYNEVADLQGRKWLCLTRSPSVDMEHQAGTLQEALVSARTVAKARHMDNTTVIVGGAEIYNAYMAAGLVDSIYATVWPEVLGGTTFIDNYTDDLNWIKVEEWPLVEDDATFDSAGLPVPMVQHWVRNRLTA